MSQRHPSPRNVIVDGMGEIRLRSALQPIFSPAHRKAVGFEALVRARRVDDSAVSPAELFHAGLNPSEVAHIDRLCREVHIAHFADSGFESGWLFINLHPQALHLGSKQGIRHTHALMERHGVSPSRVVVEILEHAIPEEGRLAETLDYYRKLGCLIALDDFGAGHSNFDRIWRLGVDIVKLDRSMVSNATRHPKARRVLPGLVELLHETNCLVLMEGIETEEEALIALESDVDLVQGFHFARPSLLREAPQQDIPLLFQELRNRQDQESVAMSLLHKSLMERIQKAFLLACRLLPGESLPLAVAPLLAIPEIRRCYLINAEGLQIGSNLARPGAEKPSPFQPLMEAQGADWSRRAYFRRAVEKPGQPQVSRPYLSLPDKAMCITLSMAVSTPDGLQVLCSDMVWNAPSRALSTGWLLPRDTPPVAS
ncbi:MAG: EAL domain-containing protein, partial [Magnetococcales bacterium]|nr:EAL domain-containing protein [Magnetococcales bacterium]